MAELTTSNGMHASQPSGFARDPSIVTPASAGSITFRSDIFGSTSNGNSNGFSHLNYGPVSNSRYHTERPNGVRSSHFSSFKDMPSSGQGEMRSAPAILIRKLSKTTSAEALASMLLFATDLIDTEFIQSPYPDADQNYATAVARFSSHTSATEAQQKLNGKLNTTRDASLVVEIFSGGLGGMGNVHSPWDRRATIDGSTHRIPTSATSSSNGSFSGTGGRSRFNSTFHSNEKHSPPLSTSNGSNEFTSAEVNSHLQSLFSPQSPPGKSFEERARVTGKSMINDDAADEETGELLKDPVAYTKNGQQGRRPTQSQPQVPISRFEGLSLSTNIIGNGMGSGVSTPRGGTSTHPQISPTSISGGQHHNKYAVNTFTRPQYPPVNPADQNPPCNTLYVGNLPLETSEDELKALFSRQKGYRRLCFRSKHNGPMCFVEFEDVMMATRTLSELYGYLLHNSTKGGIRLSFSKNPLGVRSSQNNNHATTSQAIPPNYNHFVAGNPNFSSVSGPPPGLSVPSGISTNDNNNGGNSLFPNSADGHGPPSNGQRTPNSHHPMFASNPWATSTHFSDLGPLGGIRHTGIVAAQASGNWMNSSPTGPPDQQSFHR